MNALAEPIPGITQEEFLTWARVQTAMAIYYADKRRKQVCANGHARVPTNITPSGACRQCVRVFDNRRNKPCGSCKHYRRYHENGAECYTEQKDGSPCECEKFKEPSQ